ncbi:MAG: DUF4266 domain-containing protein [Myxococcales bacterium]|jgi:hypothetical protein
MRASTARTWALAAACALAACGCATTRPWEREVLAKPVMSPDGKPGRAALRQHYLSTREGAVGGFGGGGGGCGCN